MKRISYSSGQTLIEVLVALTASVVIIAAIVSASLNALTNSDFARDQNIATQYTQAGIEMVRNMRNQDISSINPTNLPSDTYCLAKSCTKLDKTIASCWKKNTSCGQNVDIFVREVTIDHSSTDCNASPTPNGQTGYLSSNIKATVTTYWYDSKCTDTAHPFCHSVILSSCLSDFTVEPAP